MKHLIGILFLAFISLTAKSQLVVDTAFFFSAKEKSELHEQMQKLKDETTVESLVYTTPDLNGETPVQYGRELSLIYQVGLPGVNNGVVILLSRNDHKVQILVGYGLEWILSDIETQKIIDQMIPYFRQGQFYNGISQAIGMISAKVTPVAWSVHPISEFNQNGNGKIFQFLYNKNNNGDEDYKVPGDDGPQFSGDYKIGISLDGQDFDLYYSKYMNELVKLIMTKDEVNIFFRLTDYKNKKLELVGIE